MNVLIVLVLYKSRLEESRAFLALTKFIDRYKNVKLLIFNNSSEYSIAESDKYLVLNSESNVMLSGAYNYGLNYASKNKFEWLLLLDQDTEITEKYIQNTIEFVSCSNDFVAAVPILKAKDRIMSPFYYNAKKGPFWQNSKLEISDRLMCITAFNSGTILNVDYMNLIGGFSNEFPLDYLDFWYFKKIFDSNNKVFIMNCEMNHSLSLNNFSSEMSIQRYYNFLIAERQFIKLFSKKVFILYKLRLIMRFAKHLLVLKSPKHSLLTLRSVFEL